VTLVLGGWVWFSLGNLDQKLDELNDQVAEQKRPLKEASELVDKAADIDKWFAGEVSWLDQFAFLAEKSPSAEHIMFTRLNTPTDFIKHTSSIHFEGIAKESDVGSRLQKDLSDTKHVATIKTVTGGETDNNRATPVQKHYPYVIKADVGLKSPPPEKPGAKKGAPGGGAAKADQATAGSTPMLKTAVEVAPK
jgi:hypothetical protein